MLRNRWRAWLCIAIAVATTSCAGTPPSARLAPTSTTTQELNASDETAAVTVALSSQDSVQQVADGVSTTLPPAQRDIWPLTGVKGEEVGDWPALVVKIDNHDRARPQFGINSADVVFEEIVEGGITRFAAVFHSQGADIVGPIRSVRTSDFDLLRNFNRPLFANSGGNEAVLELLRDVDYVDVSSNADVDSYRRLTERQSPHNLVTSTNSLRLVGDERGGGGSPSLLFVRRNFDEPLPATAVAVKGVDVSYGATSVTYRWDQDLNGWIRSQNGSLHVDVAGVVVAPEIVIVQTISYRRSSADGRSPEAILVGEGSALVLYDGHLIEGFWERREATALTRYTDRAGEAITLPPGNTWVALPRVGQVRIVEQ